MRSLLLCIIVLFACSADAQIVHWSQANGPHIDGWSQGAELSGIYLAIGSDNHVYAETQHGVFVTSNQGVTWHLQNRYFDGKNGPGSPWGDRLAVAGQRAYIAERNNLFEVGSDTSRWHAIVPDSSLWIYNFCSVSDSIFYVAGYPYHYQNGHPHSSLYRTSNAGADWQPMFDSGLGCGSVLLTAAGTIIAEVIDTDGKTANIYRLPRGASSWQKYQRSNLYLFAANQHGVFAWSSQIYPGYAISYSLDDGLTWDSVPVPFKMPSSNLTFAADSLGGIIMKAQGTTTDSLVLTTNRGVSWIGINDGLPADECYGIEVAPDGHLWAFMKSNGIYRTDAPLSHAALSVKEAQLLNQAPLQVSVVDRVCSVKTDIETSQPVTISISSVIGQRVMAQSASPDVLRAGLTFNLSSCAAGIYFLEVSSADQRPIVTPIVLN